MPSNEKSNSKHFIALRLLYLFMIGFLIYFLYISRKGEIYTVWDAIHPAFIPMFVMATILLMGIILSAEKTQYKILVMILHSVLSHAFMVIVFPAGNIGVQQTLLGKTRLVFDNVISNGLGGSTQDILLKFYLLFRGENLQSAFSVVFARMFCVDVYWTHLLLVPLLWGIFVPLIAFKISRTVGASERISILSGLLISLFPTSIVWSKESIPNGLSYLFFFSFVYFLLKYFNSSRTRDLSLVSVFLFASFLSHYLAGTIAFSFLILANGIRTYENEKARFRVRSEFTLLLSIILSVSILPFALAYRRLFYPWADTRFSLQPLSELSPPAAFFSIMLGNYFDLISREAYITAIIFGVAPLAGLIAMIYVLRASAKRNSKHSIDPNVLFLALGVVLIVIDDRILKLFMTDVPFVEADRLWVIRDFFLVAFVALFIVGIASETHTFFDRVSRNAYSHLRRMFAPSKLSKAFSFFLRGHRAKGVSLGSIFAYVLILTVASSWVTASVYYAYPHGSPLQTTTYEIEAVKYIDQTTKERYIVVGDQWIILAGQMFVGTYNPRAFYFSYTDPHGISLFIKMKSNPSNETLFEAMKTNNATVAYFIIEKPRLGTETYNSIIQQAQQNSLQTSQTFYYGGEEKIRIFCYKKIQS